MAAVKLLLLETLNDLSYEELEKFKWLLQTIVPWRNQSYFSYSPSSNRADVVNLMVDELGHQSVEVTREVFMHMNRTDLVQKLPESSSASREKHSVDEHGAALLKREKEQEAVTQIQETLNEFSQKDLKKFKHLLPFTCFKMGLPQMERYWYTKWTERLVNLMVDELGHQSVEVTMEVLTDMNRPDLMLRLSESSSAAGSSRGAAGVGTLAAEKHLVDKHPPARGRKPLFKSYSVRCDEDPEEEGELYVQWDSDFQLRLAPKKELQSVGTRTVRKGRKTESSELEGCQSLTQDCSDWTKLKPEVNSTDADEAPTYSLQSAAGHFECRVSGLRWVCKGKTSFQYQFRSWEGHMERMESRQYMPAGPLMDVTVTAGKLNEVHLPHWICIDDVPDILDKFAVVHIDDCGDVVEKVSEVTPTHVKLTDPHFSLLAPLIRLFTYIPSIFPPKISCYTLMYYQLNTSFLKLHVYLIRQDPALEQEIAQKYCEKNDETKSLLNFKKIIKHPPDQYLQTERLFSLKADNTSAKIQPKKLTLRYNRQNFYEVYVKNPGSELILTLVHTHPADGEPADEPLWECEIRADDHPESGQAEAAGSSVGAAAVSSQSAAAGSSRGAAGVGTLAAEKHSVDKHPPARGRKALFKSNRKRYDEDPEEEEEHKRLKLQWDSDAAAQMPKALTVQSDREKLLEMLDDLKREELEKFKWFLRDRDVLVELQPIPESRLEKASTCDLVDLMVQTYTEKSVEVTKKVLKKINRNDLVQKLSDSSS